MSESDIKTGSDRISPSQAPLESSSLTPAADWLAPGFAEISKTVAAANKQISSALPALDISETASSDGSGNETGVSTASDKLHLSAAYISLNTEGPTASATLSDQTTRLNLAAGSDSLTSLSVANGFGIVEASKKIGHWTLGALPTNMAVEQTGPSTPFNTYSDIYNNVRTTAIGAQYGLANVLSKNDQFSAGITNDNNKGRGWIPNSVELSYNAPLSDQLSFSSGADIGLKKVLFNANVSWTQDNASLSVDALHSDKSNTASLEGSYKLDDHLSVSARVQTTGKKALAIRDQIDKDLFVQVQQENSKASAQLVWQIPS